MSTLRRALRTRPSGLDRLLVLPKRSATRSFLGSSFGVRNRIDVPIIAPRLLDRARCLSSTTSPPPSSTDVAQSSSSSSVATTSESSSSSLPAHPIDFDVAAKIEGSESQIVTITLEPGQILRAESGAMMYMTDGVEMNTTTGGGLSAGFQRMLTVRRTSTCTHLS